MKRALPLNYEDAARVIIPYVKYKGRLLAEVAAADLSFVKEIAETGGKGDLLRMAASVVFYSSIGEEGQND